MTSIVGTPFVDVISHHTLGTHFEGYDTQYSCSASAVENTLSLGILVDKLSCHHLGSLVSTRTECQFRVNLHHCHCGIFGQVATIMHHTIIRDINRHESLVLPLFVPVAVFRLAGGEIHLYVLKREFGNYLSNSILFIQVLLNVSFKSCSSILKRFISHLAGHCSQQVARVLDKFHGPCNCKFCFVVFHFFILLYETVSGRTTL